MADENLITLNVPHPPVTILNAAQKYTMLAQEYSIDCPEAKAFAVEDIRAIKARWTEIEEMRKHLKQPIDEGAKRIQAVFVPILEALENAAKTIKRKLDVYINEEERIAREAAELARRAAREEANRLAAEAKKIEQEGRADEARALEQQASMLPEIAAAAVPQVAAVAGAARTERWSATVVDKLALVRAVCGMDIVMACLDDILLVDGTLHASVVIDMIRSVIEASKKYVGNVPLAAIEPDMQFLNAQARALRAEMNYPGVQVVSEKTSTIRR